jgi:hypothetical protein
VGYDRYSTLLGVEDSLRGIRFEPRPSLEAELLWQIRRKGPAPDAPGEVPWLPLAAAAVGLGAIIYLFWTHVLTLPL